MKKILWLPAWYPNNTDPYAGDFIQRHARAAALFQAVQVIYVVRDKTGIITRNTLEENHSSGYLTEKIIYYYIRGSFIPFIDKIISNWQYLFLCIKELGKYIRQEGLPYCTHVHVVNRNALMAGWMKRKYGIRYVISEHWSVYLRESKPYFGDINWFFRFLWKKIMKGSSGVSVVSNHLGMALAKLETGLHYTVIPNVVDTDVFFPAAFHLQEANTHFIHISSLDFPKNAEAILEAFAILKKNNPLFILSIFGPPRSELRQLATDLGLGENVMFQNEVPQTALAESLRRSDGLILFSRYETFGCVLIEANACGIPAIVSDIPTFHEIIEEGVNGYFVPGGNAAALANKLQWFMEQGRNKSNQTIAAIAREKYNYPLIGQMFSNFYTTAVKP